MVMLIQTTINNNHPVGAYYSKRKEGNKYFIAEKILEILLWKC